MSLIDYLLPFFLSGLMVVTADLFLFVGCLCAAGLLHQNLLRNVLFSPMTFFDQTPIGRLLNRFGKDVETMDFQLVKNIESWILCLLKVLSVPIVVMLTTPLFALVCIPLFVIYAIVQVRDNLFIDCFSLCLCVCEYFVFVLFSFLFCFFLLVTFSSFLSLSLDLIEKHRLSHDLIIISQSYLPFN